MSINHMVTMAVLADLVHIAVYRFYYAYHVICYVVAAPVLIAIGYRLRLNRTLVVLAGMAAVLGFWARLVLEMDASYEISALPLVALLVYGVLQAEGWARRTTAGARPNLSLGLLTPLSLSTVFLMATPLAVTMMVYPPALSALVVAGPMLVVVHLRRGLAGLRHLLVYVWAGMAAVALMAVSGQFDYQLRAIIALPTVAQRQEAFRATGRAFSCYRSAGRPDRISDSWVGSRSIDNTSYSHLADRKYGGAGDCFHCRCRVPLAPPGNPSRPAQDYPLDGAGDGHPLCRVDCDEQC